jgi:hypothetical protein
MCISIDTDLWSMAWDSMQGAIIDNIMPTSQSEVKASKDNYMLDVDHLIITNHSSIRQFPTFPGVVPSGFAIKLQCLSQVIGWVFVDYFESLFTPPPKRKKAVPIEAQLENCLQELASSKSLSDYFDRGMDKHDVYYVSGFLCHVPCRADCIAQEENYHWKMHWCHFIFHLTLSLIQAMLRG